MQFGKLSSRPMDMEIPDVLCSGCEGEGCPHCGQRGRVLIQGDPAAFVGADMFEALFYLDLWRRGQPPIAGGALDQTEWMVRAAAFVWAEQAELRNEAMNLENAS